MCIFWNGCLRILKWSTEMIAWFFKQMLKCVYGYWNDYQSLCSVSCNRWDLNYNYEINSFYSPCYVVDPSLPWLGNQLFSFHFCLRLQLGSTHKENDLVIWKQILLWEDSFHEEFLWLGKEAGSHKSCLHLVLWWQNMEVYTYTWRGKFCFQTQDREK